jgi:hypothetical protein
LEIHETKTFGVSILIFHDHNTRYYPINVEELFKVLLDICFRKVFDIYICELRWSISWPFLSPNKMSNINFLIVDQHVIQLFNGKLCRLIIIQLNKTISAWLTIPIHNYFTRNYITKGWKSIMSCVVIYESTMSHEHRTHIKFPEAIIKSS